MLIKFRRLPLMVIMSISFFNMTAHAQTNSHAIAAGSYLNEGNHTRPLLARSHNGGSSWFYPPSIINLLPSDAGPIAFFTGSQCVKTNCLASGGYIRNTGPNTSINFPLLAASNSDGDTWSYPASIFQNLPTGFESGQFEAPPRCSLANCIAAGNFFNDTIQYPLIASSSDSGQTWSYPSSVVSNLPSNFADKGQIYTTTSVKTSFIAAGRYLTNDGTFFPMLLQSQDGGQTWNYPSSIITTLPSDYSDGAIIKSVNCSLTTCVAAGKYVTNAPNLPYVPLVAVSHDQGITWSYRSVVDNMPLNFFSLVDINQVSCSGKYCILAGEFLGVSGFRYPLLLTSTDDGDHWTAPASIFNNLPADFQNVGRFFAAHCNRKICLAVGQYQSSTRNSQLIPLIASSLDGGLTWAYKSTAISNLPTDLFSGQLNSVYCNVVDCNAEGQYRTFNNMSFPLIANSLDAGQTWTYPTTAIDNLPSDYLNNGYLAGGNSSFNLKGKKSKK